MRYLVLLAVVMGSLYAQCNQCTPDPNQSPRPYGFNPATLTLPPGRDTSLTIYFTFPDSVRQEPLLVYPNYAIWVDSLRLDRGLITLQNGQPFGYNSSNPAQGGIHFDQMHRYKKYDPADTTKKANFVIYQNPGGTPGQTPPIGCARVCVRSSATEGIDTLRVKVRAFIPALGDGDNKDTTNLAPILLGSKAWLDTVFRYVVIVGTAPASLAGVSGVVRSFTVSPNPAVYETVVRFSLAQPTGLTLRAVAIDGREVYRHTGSYAAGVHQLTLSLPAGIYTIFLDSPLGSARQKLVMVE